MSEFIDNLINSICKSMYQGLWDSADFYFNKMNGILLNGMEQSKDILTQTPSEWNSAAYSFIKITVSNAVIPIAACFLTFIFALQMINMVKESNQLHNVKPQNMILVLITLAICLTICARSFEIVNGLLEISKWATTHMPGGLSLTSGTLSSIPIPRETPTDKYNFGDVFTMLGNVLVTVIAEMFTYILVAAIYIRVNIWYLELLMYMAASPMPFSTFLHKEWGQVGTNYLRKMLAIAFEGFFMLLAFGLYQAIAGRALTGFADTADTYLLSMVSTIGSGVALLLVINKSGNISASVFNAH